MLSTFSYFSAYYNVRQIQTRRVFCGFRRNWFKTFLEYSFKMVWCDRLSGNKFCCKFPRNCRGCYALFRGSWGIWSWICLFSYTGEKYFLHTARSTIIFYLRTSSTDSYCLCLQKNLLQISGNRSKQRPPVVEDLPQYEPSTTLFR